MTQVTTIFTDKAGKAMELHGGDAGITLGIDNIPSRADREAALCHVFCSFAANDYDISRIAFDKVTFAFPLRGETVKETFTRAELEKKQTELFCRF